MKLSRYSITAIGVLLILISRATPVQAGRIFVLIAADTSKDGGIALSTGPDRGFMFDAFYANVPGRQLVFYNSDIYDAHENGEQVTRKIRNPWMGPDIENDLGDMKNKLLKAIDNCPCGPDDTVVFFYTGHGAHDSRGHYLRMPDQKTDLARETIIRRIRKKNPRLTVVITDSCNTLLDRGLAGVGEPAMASPETVSPLFHELFMKSRGLVDINSSTEGQVAAGPIGGGLLVLAMAYGGNMPDFREAKAVQGRKGAAVEARHDPRVAIPPVDYDEIIGRAFGWREHGMHSNFDPDAPPFGFVYLNSNRRLSWSAFKTEVTGKVDRLFRVLHPRGMSVDGQRQRTQTPQFYSLPKDRPVPVRNLRIEPGDVIVKVNGQQIRNTADYWRTVKNSPVEMTFEVRDRRTGNIVKFRTRLRSGNGSRFGVKAEDTNGSGVRIIRVTRGMPGANAETLKITAPTDAGQTRLYRLQPGDIIISVNGKTLRGTNDYWTAVKNSPREMHFTIRDRNGRRINLKTQLRTGQSRFGVGGEDYAGQGVRVKYVRSDGPGTRCERVD